MFPIRDDNPQLLRPYATYGIISLNILAWIAVQGLGVDPALSRSVCTFGLIPGDLLSTLPAGSQFPIGPDMACVLDGEFSGHTVLTSMFMHGSWMHLLGNMWFMWIFGDNVEDAMGPFRFVLFYVLCGLAAAAAQVFSNPQSGVPMVGASGAIGGVMGAYILLYPRVHVHMLIFPLFIRFAVPAFMMLGYWFLVQLFGGVGSLGASGGGVAFWAHIGGFAAGAVAIFLFRNSELLDQHPYHGWNKRDAPTQNWHRIK